MTVGIVSNRFRKLLDHRHLLRSGSNETHLADQDVPQLWNLVEPVFADDAAHTGDTRIAPRGELCRGAFIDAHAAELEHDKRLAEQAHA
ncbi:hypothetical protein D9M72_466160 [compost metagenome]